MGAIKLKVDLEVIRKVALLVDGCVGREVGALAVVAFLVGLGKRLDGVGAAPIHLWGEQAWLVSRCQREEEYLIARFGMSGILHTCVRVDDVDIAVGVPVPSLRERIESYPGGEI